MGVRLTLNLGMCLSSMVLVSLPLVARAQSATLTIVQEVNQVPTNQYSIGNSVLLKATAVLSVPADHPNSVTFRFTMFLEDSSSPAVRVMNKDVEVTVAPGETTGAIALQDIIVVPNPTPFFYYGYSRVTYFENFEQHTAAYQDYTYYYNGL